jgi:predicted dehydrogenase
MALRAVVVGTSFDWRVHVPALRAAGFDVVALVGRDPARTSARAAELDVGFATTSLASRRTMTAYPRSACEGAS